MDPHRHPGSRSARLTPLARVIHQEPTSPRRTRRSRSGEAQRGESAFHHREAGLSCRGRVRGMRKPHRELFFMSFVPFVVNNPGEVGECSAPHSDSRNLSGYLRSCSVRAEKSSRAVLAKIAATDASATSDVAKRLLAMGVLLSLRRVLPARARRRLRGACLRTGRGT